MAQDFKAGRIVRFATLIALLGNGAAQAMVLTFTNQAAWEAALPDGSALLTETFDGPASSFAANSAGNSAGLVTIDVNGDSPDLAAANVGLDGAGFLRGFVEDSDPGVDVEMRVNRSGMLGVALIGLTVFPTGEATLDLQEIGLDFGAGNVIGFEFLACEVLSLCTPMPPAEVPDATLSPVPFMGFVFDTSLDFFDIDHGDDIRNLSVNGASEPFLLDGLIIAERAAVANLPAPQVALLLLLGLAGLGLTRLKLR